MIGIAALALVAIATYATQLGFHERLARTGLALILGGAFGNLIDRALFGHVVDFVDVYWGIGALLGVQRRRRRDHDRRRLRPSGYDWLRTTSCTPFCLKSAGSPSTPTGCCWPPPTCSACSSRWSARRARGLDPNRIMDLGIWIIVSALVGAKLMLVVVEWDTFQWNWQSLDEPVPLGRRVLRRADRGRRRRARGTCGGTGCRCGPSTDVFAPGIALGHVIGRLGCLLAGCCFGRQTDVPWAITFHNDPFAGANVGTPLGVPLHPTQLYEAGAELLILGAAAVDGAARPAVSRAGRSGATCSSTAISRFIIEFYRGDSRGLIRCWDVAVDVAVRVAAARAAEPRDAGPARPTQRTGARADTAAERARRAA